MTVGWDPKPVPDLAGGPLRSTCRFPRDLHYYYIYKNKYIKKSKNQKKKKKEVGPAGKSKQTPPSVLEPHQNPQNSQSLCALSLPWILWNVINALKLSFPFKLWSSQLLQLQHCEPHSLITTTTTIHKFCT